MSSSQHEKVEIEVHHSASDEHVPGHNTVEGHVPEHTSGNGDQYGNNEDGMRRFVPTGMPKCSPKP